MKIAIISDSHENSENLSKVIDWLNQNKIKIIIHCGDVARMNMLEKLNNDFNGKTHLVWGNADEGFFDDLKESDFKKIIFYDKVGRLEIENKKIAWTHKSMVAKKLCLESDLEIVFYGHTHKPWEEKISGTKMINPGNVSGLKYGATFAVYDFEKNIAELKILGKI